MKFSNLMNSLVANLIPQKSKDAQNFLAEIHLQKAVSLSILDGF